MALKLLLEGASVRSIERITELHRDTILKLVTLAGEKAERLMADKIRNIQVRDVECDEVWSFVGKNEKRVRPEDDPNFGDCYTFVAIERHTKLVLNITIGKRDQRTTDVFIEGVRHATAHCQFQITTDGFAPYRSAITTTLHDRCDFAQLIKVYRAPQDGEKRYSPAEVASVEVVLVMGNPDPERICTSIVERSNLSLRMGLRRFTRLTKPSARNGKTAQRPSCFGSRITTSAVYTNHFASLRRWRRGSLITCGRSQICFQRSFRTLPDISRYLLLSSNALYLIEYRKSYRARSFLTPLVGPLIPVPLFNK